MRVGADSAVPRDHRPIGRGDPPRPVSMISSVPPSPRRELALLPARVISCNFPRPHAVLHPMSQTLLQLLLSLTLIVNSVWAPWAMAEMAHGDHGSHSMGDHHHPDGSDAPSEPASPDDGSCCDGASCQCGCVLPPALSLQATCMSVVEPIRTAHSRLIAHIVLHRDSPPLRPPAA